MVSPVWTMPDRNVVTASMLAQLGSANSVSFGGGGTGDGSTLRSRSSNGGRGTGATV